MKATRKQLSAEMRRPKSQSGRKLQRVHSLASMDEPFFTGGAVSAFALCSVETFLLLLSLLRFLGFLSDLVPSLWLC